MQLKEIPIGPSHELRSKAMDHLVMTHGLRHENVNPLIGKTVVFLKKMIKRILKQHMQDGLMIPPEMPLSLSSAPVDLCKMCSSWTTSSWTGRSV